MDIIAPIVYKGIFLLLIFDIENNLFIFERFIDEPKKKILVYDIAMKIM